MAVPNLRDHIIDVIAASGYVKVNYSPERLEEVSRAIGVLPAVLMEACLRRQSLDMRDVKLEQLPKRKSGARRAELALFVPEVIREKLKEESKNRNLSVSTMLRTLAHSYLTSTYEPERKWAGIPRWRRPSGEPYTNSKESDYILVVMSYGAKEAMRRRARARNLKPTGMLVLLVQEMFDKKIFLPGTYDIVRVVDQSDVPERFILPSGIARTSDSEEHGPQARHDALLVHIPRHGDE